MADIAADPPQPEERAACAQLGIAALCGVPLIKGGRFAAHLNVHACQPREWTDGDRTRAAAERARGESASRKSEQFAADRRSPQRKDHLHAAPRSGEIVA